MSNAGNRSPLAAGLVALIGITAPARSADTADASVIKTTEAKAADVKAADPKRSTYRSFYSDRLAFAPGDMLTVIIVESTAANSTARTRTDKADRVSASASREGAFNHEIGVSASNQFDGGGQIQRTGQLLGKLTVVVDKVDEKGNLLITGDQTITINNEQQHIAVKGTVRPEDIGPDNTIPSWRIQGATIEFKGKGILASKQSPGLLAKLFDLFGIN
jgi:flagellar L-ring protein FlgH